MATQFTYKVLAAAALGIGLSPLFGGTTSAALSTTAAELQLEPPAAPSNCRARSVRIPDPKWPHGYYTLSYASWRDNSGNEDGFTLEQWRRNQAGVWVLAWSYNMAANSTSAEVDGNGPNYRVRVRAFNAYGVSDWSNWGR